MIPKIIHFIWMQGLDAMPEDYRRCVESWAPLHPDWEIKVWSAEDLAKLKLENAWALDLPTTTFQSDVIRFELVYRFGGIYFDADHECKQPIDSLVGGRSGFVSRRNTRVIENSAFGAEPKAKWLREVMSELAANRKRLVHSFDTDAYYWMVMERHPEVDVLPHWKLQAMDTAQDRLKHPEKPFAVHCRFALWTLECPEYAGAYGRTTK